MPVANRLVVPLTVGLLAVGFLTLLGIVGMTNWLGERAQTHFLDVIAARDQRGAAVELRNAIVTAESAERGYVVTGNPIYLAPYNGARALVFAKLEALTRSVAQERTAKQLVERLSKTVADKFEVMDKVIALTRDRQEAEAVSLVRTNRGKALMDEANVFLSGIIATADQRLTEGVRYQSASTSALRWVSIIGGVVIVLVVGMVTFAGVRNTREIAQARDEVRALNASLEERVSKRTAELARERDRAAVLVKEINHRVANSLSLAASMVVLQGKSMRDAAAKAALAETQSRIFAIADVHKRLYSSDDARFVSLDAYLGGILEHMKATLRGDGHGVALVYDLDPIRMPTDASINLGIVVTEWVTNAYKYAYPDSSGEVRVKLKSVAGDRAELAVEDDGVGRDDEVVKGSGLGSRIVTAMAVAVDAEVRYDQRRPGTSARLIFRPPAIH